MKISPMHFFLILLLVGLALGSNAQGPTEPSAKDMLIPANDVMITGFIGEKLDAAYQNRILAQDEKRLIDPFTIRNETSCWQTEFWGKWFTSAVLAYRYRPEPTLKRILDKAVTDLIATQTPDGYIGNYDPDSHLQAWDIWGRKYCMLGLISYYDLTGNKQSLESAEKIANHLIRELKEKNMLIVKMGNHRGMAASSVLEPIVLLYNRTGNIQYLDFAREIVKEWESDDGPQLISKSLIPVSMRFPKPAKNWYGWEQGQKAYEMMSCYEGLLELYRVSGNPDYFKAVENTWESIRSTEINIAGSGSAMECWFGGAALQTQPIKHYQETCVTATWIKLNQQLLRLTGDCKYADAIEQTYYNALLGSMFSDGSDWAKYSPLSGERLRGTEQCKMGLNCCVASGPRGLFTLPLTAVMKETKGAVINFFVQGKFAVLTPLSQKLTIEQQTDYPVSGKIKVVIRLARPEQFSIFLRNPGWSQQSSISVNGAEQNAQAPGKYIGLNRVWKDGDTISIELDMHGRLVKGGPNNEYFAIVRGPLVLARDQRLGGPDTDEALTPILDKHGFVDLKPVEDTTKKSWILFKAPFILETHGEDGPKIVDILLCDYSFAGNTFSSYSRFRVWIPALFDPAN
ncbi:MAG: glycoside hydrolase family 127 protein [Chitinophagales bacterium]